MKTLSIAFPVLPGQEERALQFAKECTARAEEMAASYERMGLKKEEWFLQQTPQGSMVIVTMKGEDPNQAMAEWGRSQHPFDLWFKAEAGRISGIDFNQPLPELPQRIYGWQAAL